MRFGLVHRLTTVALAVLGLMALVTSGELETWLALTMTGALLLASLVPEPWQLHPRLRTFGVVASMSLLAIQSVRLVWGGEPLRIAVEFAAGLQIVRVATRRGAAHDQQIVLLSLLNVIAGTVLGGGLAYGLCFVGFLIVVPAALVLSHLRREVEGNYRQGARDRTGLPVDVPRILRSRRVISRRFLMATCALSVPIFLFTATLFVVFPRVGLSLLLLKRNTGDRMVGFSDRVDLGNVGRLRSDPTIALRVHMPNLGPEPAKRVALYLRGAAFDEYNGRSWLRNKRHQPVEGGQRRIWVYGKPLRVGPELMTISLEPIKPPVVFLPSGSAAFDILSNNESGRTQPLQITRGREGDFEYGEAEPSGLRYRVYSTPNSFTPRLLRSDARRYLRVPKNLSPRVQALARQWTEGISHPREIATQLEIHLRNDYQYDLDSPSGGADNPLEHFLFNSRRGHCEYYSTSMAMMLRLLGIPSRNVTGFIGGTLNRFGHFYSVRQGDAHSWVEAFIEGTGWVRFDPTPVAQSAPQAEIGGIFAFMRDLVEAAGERWDRNVLGYDLDQQVGLLKSMRQSWGGASASRAWLKANGRILLIGVWTLLGVGIVWRVLWLRRKRNKEDQPLDAEAARRATESATAIALYQHLEDALRTRGVPRPPETPPRAHALALVALGHPNAEEILKLTEIYLGVRFGRAILPDNEAVSYRHRVAELRRSGVVPNQAA